MQIVSKKSTGMPCRTHSRLAQLIRFNQIIDNIDEFSFTKHKDKIIGILVTDEYVCNTNNNLSINHIEFSTQRSVISFIMEYHKKIYSTLENSTIDRLLALGQKVYQEFNSKNVTQVEKSQNSHDDDCDETNFNYICNPKYMNSDIWRKIGSCNYNGDVNKEEEKYCLNIEDIIALSQTCRDLYIELNSAYFIDKRYESLYLDITRLKYIVSNKIDLFRYSKCKTLTINASSMQCTKQEQCLLSQLWQLSEKSKHQTKWFGSLLSTVEKLQLCNDEPCFMNHKQLVDTLLLMDIPAESNAKISTKSIKMIDIQAAHTKTFCKRYSEWRVDIINRNLREKQFRPIGSVYCNGGSLTIKQALQLNKNYTSVILNGQFFWHGTSIQTCNFFTNINLYYKVFHEKLDNLQIKYEFPKPKSDDEYGITFWYLARVNPYRTYGEMIRHGLKSHKCQAIVSNLRIKKLCLDYIVYNSNESRRHFICMLGIFDDRYKLFYQTLNLTNTVVHFELALSIDTPLYIGDRFDHKIVNTFQEGLCSIVNNFGKLTMIKISLLLRNNTIDCKDFLKLVLKSLLYIDTPSNKAIKIELVCTGDDMENPSKKKKKKIVKRMYLSLDVSNVLDAERAIQMASDECCSFYFQFTCTKQV